MFIKMRKTIAETNRTWEKGKLYNVSITRAQAFTDKGEADVVPKVRIVDGVMEEYKDGQQFNTDRSLKQVRRPAKDFAGDTGDDEDEDITRSTPVIEDRAIHEPPRGKGR
jgi:hypothetical protein